MASREVRRLEVTYGDPQATYRPGEVVSGVVHLELASELKMKSVKMSLQGVSRVNWDEKRSYTKGSSTQVSHKNVDVYLDETCILVSRVENNVMKAGRYDWKFSVRLPSYIPASYEGQYGRVQYWTKVALDQPFKKDTEMTRPFTVLGSLDLNTEGDAKKPVEAIGDIMVGTLCFKSGPVTGQLTLPTRGFVSGQNIPFCARINNTSRKMLRDVHIALIQQVTFRADKRVRKQTSTLKGLQWRDVNVGENATWEDQLKGIPSVVPSRLGAGCKSIEVKYLVQLTGHPKGMGKTMDVSVEVVIGTVPLRCTDSPTHPRGHRKGRVSTVAAPAEGRIQRD